MNADIKPDTLTLTRDDLLFYFHHLHFVTWNFEQCNSFMISQSSYLNQSKPLPLSSFSAPTPTYEACPATFGGAVSLRDGTDDGVSLRGDLTYNPVYTYYETVGKAPE